MTRIEWIKAVLAAFFLFGASLASAVEPVVKVNDTVLTERDLDEALNEIVPAAVFHGGMTPEKRASFIPKAIEALIERELLYQEAKALGMTIEKGRIEQAKANVISRAGGKGEFKKALKKWGLSEKELKLKIEKLLLVQDIVRIEIEEKAAVTPEEVKDYYEKNKSSYVRPEARRIRHILIKVEPYAGPEDRAALRQRAGEVLRKAKAGEDFGTLAWENSDDPYRVKGGDYGHIHRGRFDPNLDDVAFGLPAGGISNVIETIYGFHIIKVEEAKPEEQLGFEEVSQGIERRLRQERLKARKEEFIGGLKARAKIEVYKK